MLCYVPSMLVSSFLPEIYMQRTLKLEKQCNNNIFMYGWLHIMKTHLLPQYLSTTYLPPNNYPSTTYQLLVNYLSTTCQLPVNSLFTTYQFPNCNFQILKHCDMQEQYQLYLLFTMRKMAPIPRKQYWHHNTYILWNTAESMQRLSLIHI